MPDLPLDAFPNLSVNKRVPVITPEGANPAAYDDPNSPESILRRVRQTEVQAQIDRKYDVPVSPYQESFCVHAYPSNPYNSPLILVLVIAAGLSLRALFGKRVF
jgi:hypothetical protein